MVLTYSGSYLSTKFGFGVNSLDGSEKKFFTGWATDESTDARVRPFC